MKKLIIFILSLLAVSTFWSAGCTSPDTDAEKTQNHDIVQEEPNDGCKDNNCEDKNKPEFKFVHPEHRELPHKMPHKRHGESNTAPMPIIPENPESD